MNDNKNLYMYSLFSKITFPMSDLKTLNRLTFKFYNTTGEQISINDINGVNSFKNFFPANVHLTSDPGVIFSAAPGSGGIAIVDGGNHGNIQLQNLYNTNTNSNLGGVAPFAFGNVVTFDTYILQARTLNVLNNGVIVGTFTNGAAGTRASISINNSIVTTKNNLYDNASNLLDVSASRYIRHPLYSTNQTQIIFKIKTVRSNIKNRNFSL